MTAARRNQAYRRLREMVARAVRSGTSRIVSIGGYRLTVRGRRWFDPRDLYHTVIALSWWRFLLLAVGACLAMNVAFAVLYVERPGAVANARAGSFADAFFFSVETAATVGYGDMYPATLFGHIVCTVEIFTGIAFTTLTTGLLLVRFSRPKARFFYAENAVVASHRNRPTLMIRVANGRHSLLYDAVAHLSLLINSRNEQGEVIRAVHELRLERTGLPMMLLTWTLMHVVDETSPLFGYDTARLVADDAYLVLGVGARDVTLAAQVMDTKGYASAAIRFGMRYADVLSFDSHQHPVADLASVSQMEPDVGPEPRRSGWDDRSAAEPGAELARG